MLPAIDSAEFNDFTGALLSTVRAKGRNVRPEIGNTVSGTEDRGSLVHVRQARTRRNTRVAGLPIGRGGSRVGG